MVRHPAGFLSPESGPLELMVPYSAAFLAPASGPPEVSAIFCWFSGPGDRYTRINGAPYFADFLASESGPLELMVRHSAGFLTPESVIFC